MTDHPIRLFADDATICHVGAGLLARTLQREEWTHEAHLAACCWLLAERPEINAAPDLPDIIRDYSAGVGGVNDDRQGYPETITQLYVAAVRCWLSEAGGGGRLRERVNALLISPLGKRDWPLTLYSRKRLLSVEARRGLVMPDVGDWPGPQ